MPNPLRSEDAAFRFLLGVIVYFGLIGIASALNTWAGLAVFLLETVALVVWWLTRRGRGRTAESRGGTGPAPRP